VYDSPFVLIRCSLAMMCFYAERRILANSYSILTQFSSPNGFVLQLFAGCFSQR
jgi:hypothetical protein